MSPLPSKVWSELSADFYGPLPSGGHLLVIVDDYSRFPVVEFINNVSADCVIPIFEKVFSTFGTPELVRTDNGAPFQSQAFKEFSLYMGFHHRRITPYFPQANGECERFMRNIGKTMRIAHSLRLNWRCELQKFLRNYRATPHSTLQKTPAELLFSRSFRTRFPESADPATKDKFGFNERDQRSKDQMKSYADHRRRARVNDLAVGDCVLIRQPAKSKVTPPFDPDPFTVIEVKGSMITVQRKGKRITRNTSFFKKFNHPLQTPIEHPTRLGLEETNQPEEDEWTVEDEWPMADQGHVPVEQQQDHLPDPIPPAPLLRRYPQRIHRRRPLWLQC